VCGLNYGFADPADGPAFFAMTAMSFPVVGLALWFDAAYAPPWWVHLVTTLPLLIVLCALPLRLSRDGSCARNISIRQRKDGLRRRTRLATSTRAARKREIPAVRKDYHRLSWKVMEPLSDEILTLSGSSSLSVQVGTVLDP